MLFLECQEFFILYLYMYSTNRLQGKSSVGGGGGGLQMKDALAMNFTGLSVHNIDNYCYAPSLENVDKAYF